jgi:hypothetical protein
MRNEVNKTIEFERLHCWYNWMQLLKYRDRRSEGDLSKVTSLRYRPFLPY